MSICRLLRSRGAFATSCATCDICFARTARFGVMVSICMVVAATIGLARHAYLTLPFLLLTPAWAAPDEERMDLGQMFAVLGSPTTAQNNRSSAASRYDRL